MNEENKVKAVDKKKEEMVKKVKKEAL